MARNWADLPPELLGLCSQHLCLKDLSAFRAVCRSRQSAAVDERSDVPWLMLAKGKSKQKQWREFFCLQCQRVHIELLPIVTAKRCFSSRGWLLTIGIDREVHMLKNPMLRRHGDIIKLPNLNKLPDVHVERLLDMYPRVYGDFIITKFVLSDSAMTSTDYKVMVICTIDGRLGLWKPGDERWTAVTSPCRYNLDVIFYSGCFLALNRYGSIVRCDVDGPTPFTAQVVLEMPQRLKGCEQLYLVQSTTGSLLMVSRQGHGKPRGTVRFRVFEIDLETRSWRRVKTLKNTSLFLGWNSSFSLEVDENHHIKPNCIYFTDDCLESYRCTEDGGGLDMGIYHLEDGTIEPHFKGKSYSHFSSSLWIETNF